MATDAWELLYKDQGISVYWDDVTESIELEGRGNVSSSQYRLGFMSTIQSINSKRCSKLLVNLDNMGRIADEDLLWTVTEANDRLAKTQIKFAAVIMPRTLGIHVAFDKFLDSVIGSGGSSAIQARFFNDVKSAREWLAQQ